jgi:predicted DNA-binding transcriptional regulator AlpA
VRAKNSTPLPPSRQHVSPTAIPTKDYSITTRWWARQLGVTHTTIRTWATRGRLPPALRLTPQLWRWRRTEALAWLAERGMREVAADE